MKYKKNTLQREAIYEPRRWRFLLIFGIVLILIGTTVFFAGYRPFTKFVYYECVFLGEEWILVDRNHIKVIYYVDGKKYEKILYITDDDFSTKITIYYNAENPNDAMRAQDRTTALLISLFVTGVGVISIFLGITNYKKFNKISKRGEK